MCAYNIISMSFWDFEILEFLHFCLNYLNLIQGVASTNFNYPGLANSSRSIHARVKYVQKYVQKRYKIIKEIVKTYFVSQNLYFIVK